MRICPEIKRMRRKIDRLYEMLAECMAENTQLQSRVAQLTEAKVNLEESNRLLRKRLSTALEPINIPEGTGMKVSCGQVHELLRSAGFRDIDIADTEYIAIPVDQMDDIFRTIAYQLEDKVKYTKQVWDCDNYAELVRVLIAYSAYKQGLPRQLAVGVGWSRIHAYNVAIVQDDGLRVAVYEPQTGRRVDSMTGVYEPREAFFTT